ncbi:hypothetical protein SZMC14600_05167 [Saccharomonospora azurea SZMC 14600]|nr:hypothetical protein SZMC14600_05167 [Saccharomonospora azurea SZMC 14600]
MPPSTRLLGRLGLGRRPLRNGRGRRRRSGLRLALSRLGVPELVSQILTSRTLEPLVLGRRIVLLRTALLDTLIEFRTPLLVDLASLFCSVGKLLGSFPRLVRDRGGPGAGLRRDLRESLE